jgi:hypothetical protein
MIGIDFKESLKWLECWKANKRIIFKNYVFMKKGKDGCSIMLQTHLDK